jgi:hypothetical protein
MVYHLLLSTVLYTVLPLPPSPQGQPYCRLAHILSYCSYIFNLPQIFSLVKLYFNFTCYHRHRAMTLSSLLHCVEIKKIKGAFAPSLGNDFPGLQPVLQCYVVVVSH